MGGSPDDLLLAAHGALRARLDDFRQALSRRDEAAYRLALADFLANLRRWSAAVEETLSPAIVRMSSPRRDLPRELRLDFVQLRELARHITEQLDTRASMSDVLGMVENLSRRFDAHGAQIRDVYAPAAAEVLDEEAWSRLRAAAPDR